MYCNRLTLVLSSRAMVEQLVIEGLAQEVAELRDTLRAYRELSLVAVSTVATLNDDIRSLAYQFETLREELRRYTRAKVES